MLTEESSLPIGEIVMHSETLTRAQSRRVDAIAMERYGLAGIVLMENAGRGAVELLKSLGLRGKVTICCGAGNNGGDGLVMARHLGEASHDVQVLLFADPETLRGDAAANYDRVTKSELPVRVISNDATYEEVTGFVAGSAWIVDALLGTGATGLPRPPYATAIRAINTAGVGGVKSFAVDLPSGLDADAGEPFRDEAGKYGPCVRADITATFVARKIGFDRPSAREFTGDIVVIDIGVPPSVVEEAKRLD
jgi:NAD(P)H-hydrate epimerase